MANFKWYPERASSLGISEHSQFDLSERGEIASCRLHSFALRSVIYEDSMMKKST